MIGMTSLTKADLHELVENTFPDARESETVAVLTTIRTDDCTQQCILLKKEVNEYDEIMA